jgi:hypothetical protein
VKKFLLLSVFILSGGLQAIASPLNSPGNIFIRQKAGDETAYLKAFLDQAVALKAQTISGYGFHRDLKEKNVYILSIKCSDLEKGLGFVQSPEFMAAMDKVGARVPQIWWGLDEIGRTYRDLPEQGGGIVIARNEVRDYDFWLKCFKAQSHKHEGRQYKNSDYSIHHLPGNPAVAIVVHEASDVSKAPAFMTSDALNGEMESTGVVGLEIWYGINIEEGIF